VEGLQVFTGRRLSESIGLLSSGLITSYSSGTVVDINWTIDQTARTFSATALGGSPVTSVFPNVSASMQTTPVQGFAGRFPRERWRSFQRHA
jgi:hypothetical protein